MGDVVLSAAKMLTSSSLFVLEIHHTPKHGSWLNIAEIELSALTRQCLDRRISTLAALNAWQPTYQHQPAPGRLAVHHRRRPNQAPPSIPKALEATVY
jgi:hypothetical protein